MPSQIFGSVGNFYLSGCMAFCSRKISSIIKLLISSALLIPCVALAENGWRKHDSVNTFNSVALTKAEHDRIVKQTNSAPFWGGQGPNAVLRTWNSAAYDADNQIMYFFGGGHSDYGGNEVYSYSINDKKWQRVSEPQPLTQSEPHSKKPKFSVYFPKNSPLAPHTWDGLVWNPQTQSIWLAQPAGFGGPGGKPSHDPSNPALWEFKPRTKKWIRYPVEELFFRPMTTYLPSRKKILVVDYTGKSERTAILVGAQGRITELGVIEGFDATGVATLFTRPDTGQIYASHLEGIYEIMLEGNKISARHVLTYPPVEKIHISSHLGQASFNYRPVDGKFYIWNGGRKLLTWHPETNQLSVLWNEGQSQGPSRNAKGFGKIFDKFVYVPTDDVFIGAQFGGDATGPDGVWVYDPNQQQTSSRNLQVAPPVVDGQTATSVSIFMPVLRGDKNFNSTVDLYFRKRGSALWQEGMSLFRIRPDLVRNSKNKAAVSQSGFAGMVTGLAPDTKYEFKMVVREPDKHTDRTQTFNLKAQTAAQLTASKNGAVVYVNNDAKLSNALKSLKAGDTLVLNPGRYEPFQIKVSGTSLAPITIKGNENLKSVIDGRGGNVGLRVQGDNVVVKQLTVVNAKRGIQITSKRKNVALLENQINNTQIGIEAKGGVQSIYIHNNRLIGPVPFAEHSRKTWKYKGIKVAGQNVEISNNTLRGFGDAIGVDWNTDVPNKSINIHHNLIEWGSDDGIEMDFTSRNVATHHNMIAYTSSGLSFQPVWGGPAIAFRNVVLNASTTPLKIKPEKDDPIGILVFHNTFIKGKTDGTTGEAWKNASGVVSHLALVNNLFLSEQSNAKFTLKNNSKHQYITMSHNGWSADGRFSIKMVSGNEDVWAQDFEQWKTTTELGENDSFVSLKDVFTSSRNKWRDSINLTTVFQSSLFSDIGLNRQSNAIDNGLRLPFFNSNFRGAGPDLGAYEFGQSAEHYGVTSAVWKRIAVSDNYHPWEWSEE